MKTTELDWDRNKESNRTELRLKSKSKGNGSELGQAVKVKELG